MTIRDKLEKILYGCEFHNGVHPKTMDKIIQLLIDELPEANEIRTALGNPVYSSEERIKNRKEYRQQLINKLEKNE